MRSVSQSRGRLTFLLTFALLTWGIFNHPRASADDKWAENFPNVTLRTQDNRAVRFYDDLIKNKVAIINFMYTHCDGQLCDRGTKNLVQVQKSLGDRLGRDIFIYSITLDPKHDTPEVLKAYAERYGAKSGWTFLTVTDNGANQSEIITDLRKRLGLANVSPALRTKLGMSKQNLNANAIQKQHSGMIVLVNDAFKRSHKAKILARPDEILEMIKRMEPPPKK